MMQLLWLGVRGSCGGVGHLKKEFSRKGRKGGIGKRKGRWAQMSSTEYTIEGKRTTFEGEEDREQMNKRGRDGECGLEGGGKEIGGYGWRVERRKGLMKTEDRSLFC